MGVVASNCPSLEELVLVGNKVSKLDQLTPLVRQPLAPHPTTHCHSGPLLVLHCHCCIIPWSHDLPSRCEPVLNALVSSHFTSADHSDKCVSQHSCLAVKLHCCSVTVLQCHSALVCSVTVHWCAVSQCCSVTVHWCAVSQCCSVTVHWCAVSQCCSVTVLQCH